MKVMTGPLSPAEANLRMAQLKKVIDDEAEKKKQLISTEARNSRDALKKKMVSRLMQGVNQKYERLVTDQETELRKAKSSFILASRLQCQNDRYGKAHEIKGAVEKKLLQKFTGDAQCYRKFMKEIMLESSIRLLEQNMLIRCLEKVALIYFFSQSNRIFL